MGWSNGSGPAGLALACAVALMLSACAARPVHPRSLESASPPSRLAFDNYGHIRLPVGARVLAIGDDMVGPPAALPGAKLKVRKRSPPAAEPYTTSLAAALGPSVTLDVETRPGQRADQALAAFPSLPHADVVIMLLGPGDLWGRATSTPYVDFSETLRQLIAAAQAQGSVVILVAPLPVSNAALNGGLIQTYREVVRARASLTGSELFNPRASFAQIHHLWSDGVHLATPGSRALAGFLAGYFIVPKG